MKTTKLGANAMILKTNHLEEVLYSHNEAVAGFSLEHGYFVVAGKQDKRNARHIKKYLDCIDNSCELSEADLEQLFLNR